MKMRVKALRTVGAGSVLLAFIVVSAIAATPGAAQTPRGALEASARQADVAIDAKAASELAAKFGAALRAGDAKGARSLLLENYNRLRRSDPARIKGEFAQLMRTAGTDLTGPALTYLLALQGQGELSPSAHAGLDKTLTALVGATTLNPRSDVACLLAQQRLLEQLAGNRPVSQELWLENLACDSEQNTPEAITLRDGLVLDAIDAPTSFVYLFDRPAGIAAGFTARIDPAPPQPVIFNTDGRQLVLQTLPLREVPADARTQVYAITLTSAGRDHVYHVVLPVNLGMDVPVLPVLAPGTPIDVVLRASGGGACAALPQGVQLPCGPMTWQWIPDPGAGPLPAGINVYPLPDGNARLSGTPQSGAVSSKGRLHLDQAGRLVERPRLLPVPVHLASGEREALLGPHALLRGESFSLRLPQALGGDGQTYDWSIDPAEPPLPPSVQLVDRTTGVWLEGLVDQATPLGRHAVRLKVTSPLAPAPTLFQAQLDVGQLLRVWTQNGFLRPPDVFSASFYAETSALLLSPLDAPLAGALLTAAGAIEAYWDVTVQNTSDDNEERTSLILDRATGFDIVALQEAFSQQAEQLVDGALSRGFFALSGPGGREWRLPLNLSTGAVQAAIPLQSSGLFLLVRKDLFTPPTPLGGLAGPIALEVTRLAALGHTPQQFTTCNGLRETARTAWRRRASPSPPFTSARLRTSSCSS